MSVHYCVWTSATKHDNVGDESGAWVEDRSVDNSFLIIAQSPMLSDTVNGITGLECLECLMSAASVLEYDFQVGKEMLLAVLTSTRGTRAHGTVSSIWKGLSIDTVNRENI